MASAQAESPTQVVKASIDAVLMTLGDDSLEEMTKRRQAVAILRDRFDFEAMARRVLATDWETITLAQRKQFTALFRELLINSYWHRIAAYRGERIDYVGEHLRGPDLATVRISIDTAKVDIPVEFKLERHPQRWLAYDVVIEQISLVRNYRHSYHDIIHASGIEGLLDHLRLSVAESSAADAR